MAVEKRFDLVVMTPGNMQDNSAEVAQDDYNMSVNYGTSDDGIPF
jgi:hypothetical protein